MVSINRNVNSKCEAYSHFEFTLDQAKVKNGYDAFDNGATVKNKAVFSLELIRNEKKVDAYMAYVYDDVYKNIINDTDNFLHNSERNYFTSLKSEKRRFTYLTGRFAGKLALSQYLHEPNLRAIEIRSGCFDQPLAKHLSFDTPEVTLSHCSDLAVAITYQAGHIMGIDVEEIDFSKSHVLKSQLTEAEAIKAQQNFEDYRIGYHLMWTAKEALSKALKCGLTVPFDILEIEDLNSQKENNYTSIFKNFAQYKCISWIMDRHLLSITLPRKTEMGTDVLREIRYGQQTS